MANIEIGGRLHSTATGNVVTGANEVLDDNQNKKQQEINAELIEAVDTAAYIDDSESSPAVVPGFDPQTDTVHVTAQTLSEAQKEQVRTNIDVYSKGETYSAVQLNNMITTPNQQYVSVTATAQTTSATDVLPATGAADTVYRVGNWDGTQYNDSVFSEYAWNGSTYIKLSTKSQIGEVYDISANHADTKYVDLAAALNGGANIPQSLQKGGMRVQFVQSSDNKYVRYNLLATSFTTDVTKWAIAEEGVYVDNPEFIYVKTDNEGKILWAIKADGSIYYGAGVPQQVIDYINEKIAELSLDEYEDIVAFLNGLEEGDKTLQTLLNEKVDKEEGKSLIDAEYASSQSTIENPEFLDITTDSEDKVLEGIQADGTKVIGGDLKVLGNMEVSGVSYKVIENPEYLVAWVDAEDKIIFGFKADGKTYVGDADFLDDIESIKVLLAKFSDKNIDLDALTSITDTENPEFIEAKTDSEGKLLAGRTPDGAAFEKVGFSTPKISVNGTVIKNIEDPEGRSEITTDSERKIISYRDVDGVKHENIGLESKSITTNSLHLTSDGMTEFQQALIESGFNPKMPIDWSDEEELRLPIPRTCAKVNLIVENLPTSKTADYEALLEYSDLDGNYFKKPIILNAQGSSSMQYIEKNLGFDLDDGSEIQFGNWVAQDSFHLKCYYIDVFRGEANICYNYTNEVIKYLNCRANRVLNDNSATTASNGIGKFNKDFGSSALCQPDGFPIEVYHNGTYYGLFTWNLKKHRKNYQMKKDDYSQALMDGEIHSGSFFGGTINWTLFELRNPKTLYLMDGVTKYDGENPREIISPTMIVEGQEVPNPNYDANNSNHVKTYQTKAMLEELSQVVPTLNGMAIDTPEGLQAAKTLYEEHFDKDMMICYFILSNVLFHLDGFAKNWIWTVYNGIAAPTFYDMDTMFGRHWTGGKMWPGYNTSSILGNDVSQPCGQAYRLYQTEIEATYADLRAKKYIDVDYIIGFFNDWLKRQTREAVERNIKKWTAIPSYRENGGSYPPPLSYDASVQNEGMYDSIGRVRKWLEARIPALDTFFNYNQN